MQKVLSPKNSLRIAREGWDMAGVYILRLVRVGGPIYRLPSGPRKSPAIAFEGAGYVRNSPCMLPRVDVDRLTASLMDLWAP